MQPCRQDSQVSVMFDFQHGQTVAAHSDSSSRSILYSSAGSQHDMLHCFLRRPHSVAQPGNLRWAMRAGVCWGQPWWVSFSDDTRWAGIGK